MKHLRPSIVLNLWFIVLFGFAFPFMIFGLAQAMFPRQANGSMITANGKVVGSELIGQNFSKPEYFHPRPSAAGSGYDATNSGGTNLGPTSDKLINGVVDTRNPSDDFDGVKQLAAAYRKENNLAPDTIVPVDAVTRSGSGLDPDISPENAGLQAASVAAARKMSLDDVKKLIAENTSDRWAGIYGEPRVNVLKLNIALDARK